MLGVMREIGWRVRRFVGWAAKILVAVILFYAAAGLIGGSIPANAGWKPPAQGVTILIADNGIHTGLILPKTAAGVDWSVDFPASDISDPRYAKLGWVAVGWGDRAFYVDTPTWSDINPPTVLRAATGSTRTVLHVEHILAPAPARDVRAIVVTEDEYRRLAAFIRATRGPGGKVAAGYGVNDVFYDGQGTYSALTTCNAWTGRALRSAGVRVGVWTPFPVDVMTWF